MVLTFITLQQKAVNPNGVQYFEIINYGVCRWTQSFKELFHKLYLFIRKAIRGMLTNISTIPAKQ